VDYIAYANNNIIFETLTGSRAYGTSTDNSDYDYRGIFVGSKINILTPFYNVEQVQTEGDRTIYEFRKFMKLVVEQNPNILELLWVRDCDIITNTPLYSYIRGYRDQLLSTKIKHTFVGYAHAQLKRLKNAHNMLLTTQTPNTNRNPTRAQLEHNYGYDTKYGMHLIRLLKMCKETLITKQLSVYREDAQDLLSIRNGYYTFEQLVQYSEQLMNEIENTPTDLPYSIDIEFVSHMMVTIYNSYWN